MFKKIFSKRKQYTSNKKKLTGKKNAPKDSEAEKDRPVLEADLATPVNSKGHSKPAAEEVR